MHTIIETSQYTLCNTGSRYLAYNSGIPVEVNHWQSAYIISEPCREKMGLRTYANSKASGEPAHPLFA